ncbi:hypothetical protein LGM57_27285 [Burkholderia cepacia]|uniref:hypothetical protein n=1 Tax=Burkholderia cepacia TaxID=292 RepID=UPI001CF559DD|nr:hypothetical protein [Burkholderia cepacia]MCA7980031.1 hypothetical protein [Burkholderia cepacia]
MMKVDCTELDAWTRIGWPAASRSLIVDRFRRPGHQLLDQCRVKVQAVVPGSIVTSSLRLRGIKVVPWLSVYASHKRSDKLRPGKKMVAGFAPRFISIITIFCGIVRER